MSEALSSKWVRRNGGCILPKKMYKGPNPTSLHTPYMNQ